MASSSASRSGIRSGSWQWWCRMSHTTGRPMRRASDRTSRSAKVRSSFSTTSRARAASDSCSKPSSKRSSAACDAAGRAAHVQHDDGLGAQAHAVQQLGLDLELLDGEPPDALVLGVQDGVLAGVGRQADPQARGQRADLGEPLARTPAAGRGTGSARGATRTAPARWPSGTSRCRGRRGTEDRLEVVERDAQVGLGLPAPRVVRRQPTRAQDLDREAETHVASVSRLVSASPSGPPRRASRRSRRRATR